MIARPFFRPWFWLVAVVGLVLSLPLAGPSVAQDDEDEDQPFRSGLIATYTGGEGAIARRIDDSVQFDWGNRSPDARLPAGPFTAEWRGTLIVHAAGPYHFYLHGAGEAELSLGGKLVVRKDQPAKGWAESGPIELPAEDQPLELKFKATGQPASLGLFWSGPGFVREPISPRFFQHDREQSPPLEFERGQALAKALRCSACHAEEPAEAITRAPALDRLRGNLDPQWMIDWLAATDHAPSLPNRRMPHFALSRDDAAAITAWLQTASQETPKRELEPFKPKPPAKGNANDKTKAAEAEKPTARRGEQLALTLGCLACHQIGELGQSGLFGGGDLTNIAAKRPAEFFAHWLSHPADLNQDHRMPVFDLSPLERDSLALYLQQLKPKAEDSKSTSLATKQPDQATLARGKQLVAALGCASCHRLPEKLPASTAARQPKALTARSDEQRSCLNPSSPKPHQPRYSLSRGDADAIRHYLDARKTAPPAIDGRWLLVEQNCLACHTREGMSDLASVLPPPLAEKLTAVADAHSELATRVPALTPPSLNSVGDKMHDTALTAAIRRQGPPHRTYLQVRMPKFNLSDEQLQSLANHLIAADRIPPYASTTQPPADPPTSELATLRAAGNRLVTTDGFGCTSCHTVGGIDPPNAPANARGPELAGMHERLRSEWYDRWVRNPARIVPRMEMPSVQLAVRGVLHDNIDQQLAAVWHTLKTPGFKPPEPNPVRVLRRSGDPTKPEAALTLNDVIKADDKTWLFPLVVGLPNRHNVMFDLEHNHLARWWIGDMARQRTKGKTWFWEQGGPTVFDPQIEGSEISLLVDGKEIFPQPRGQFLADLTGYGPGELATPFEAVLTFKTGDGKKPTDRSYEQSFKLHEDTKNRAFSWRRVASLNRNPATEGVKLRLLGPSLARQSQWDAERRTLRVPGGVQIQVLTPEAEWNNDGTLTLPPAPNGVDKPVENRFVLDYTSDLPADQYLVDPPPVIPVEATSVAIAPGLHGQRLPLPAEITPTGLAWRDNGELVFSTLKGELFSASDSDSDGLADYVRCLGDGLATPYGVQTGRATSGGDYIDVVTKSGLFRLRGASLHRVASGWGYTDDYHDWAVGLPRDKDGNYYLGIPCQQDNRSEAAAKHRGEVLKLVPRTSTSDDTGRMFDIATVTRGHRFPMGLALRKDGELFVTDNQGNYNPFNELNHVKPGAHFGFINAIEKKDPERAAAVAKQPLVEPAVNIPHPWTRSVNGICFLETPEPGLAKLGRSTFGPFEGHLVGCEYDTRRLIRMTVEEVGGKMQGAAYPLSIDPPASDAETQGLLGPIVCAVSPQGDLYVGNIRDSGWGAGNNIGEIVRVRVEPDKLPCGIQEVKCTADGFAITFLQPIDPAKGRDVGNYSIASYRRESTPAYGGPDLDRRTEKVEAAEVSSDGRQVRVKVPDRRLGFVYEIRLKNLAPGGGEFFPSEAHYTLHAIP